MDASTDAATRAHRELWSLGDYDRIGDLIADLGEDLVAASGLAAGDRVLDVAAGSGNAALPAARTAARVVATDLTPELVQRGRARAEEDGLGDVLPGGRVSPPRRGHMHTLWAEEREVDGGYRLDHTLVLARR